MKKDDVDDLNHAILNYFPSELPVFQSADLTELIALGNFRFLPFLWSTDFKTSK